MSYQPASLGFQPNILPGGLYHRIDEGSFRLSALSDEPGIVELPSVPNTIVSIHVGPSVQVACRRGGSSFRGTAVHGDIEIIPAYTPGTWEIKQRDNCFLLSISPKLLNLAIEEIDVEPRRVEIRNIFQTRDVQLEHIGWALKAEMEAGYPCGRLYLDSLALSAVARLVRCHSSLPVEQPKQMRGLSGRRLKDVLGYIEDNLSQDLSLSDIAAVARISVSHFKSLFRESVGIPAHQYLIRRRVERARSLLGEGKMSISQIAFETGFAHQSHLARHMRRLLGVSPKALRDTLR
jgi:AraC family transcriptional regulator